MENVESRVQALELRMDMMEKTQNESKTDIKEVKKDVGEIKSDVRLMSKSLGILEKGWTKFDDMQKDNYNKIKMQVALCLIATIVSAYLVFKK